MARWRVLVLLQMASNKDRVKCLLEALQNNWNNEYFDKLCNLLETVDHSRSSSLHGLPRVPRAPPWVPSPEGIKPGGAAGRDCRPVAV